MSVDDAVKVIGAITKLVAALARPALVGYGLVRFGPSLKDPKHKAEASSLERRAAQVPTTCTTPSSARRS